MNFRTITARYAGTCRRCRGPITPGARIRFGGRGQTYHMAAECPASQPEPAFAVVGAVAYEADRDALVSITRNGAGEVISYRNRAGRCEDAPCCGCCS